MISDDEHKWLVQQIEGDKLSPRQVWDLIISHTLRTIGAKREGREPQYCYIMILSTFTDDGISDCIRCVSDHFPTVDEVKTYLVRSLLQGAPPPDTEEWWNADNSIESGDLNAFGKYLCEIKGPMPPSMHEMFADLDFQPWPLSWEAIYPTLSKEKLGEIIEQADEPYR